MDAALEQFAERGYHNTGVADIAAALRMSHGTFYRYFESKRDILDQLITALIGRIAAAVGAEDGPGAAATLAEYRDQVRAIATALLGVAHEDPRIARVILLEATGVDGELTARILDLLDRLRELSSAYLRHGIEAGFLRSDLEIAGTARALNGIIYAGALHAIRADGAPGAGQFVDAAVRLMFDGISR